MTPEQKAFSALFYEGLIQRLKVESARVEHGEGSIEHTMEAARVEANSHLAAESLREVDNPTAKAAWRGYLSGVQRFAGVGDPSYPRDLEVREEPSYERSVDQLFYDELDGWMREFYADLEPCLGLIDMGALEIQPDHPLAESFYFFTSVAKGIDDSSGNFGDGFTKEDRERVNNYVDGSIKRVAEAVRASFRIGERTWPVP